MILAAALLLLHPAITPDSARNAAKAAVSVEDSAPATSSPAQPMTVAAGASHSFLPALLIKRRQRRWNQPSPNQRPRRNPLSL